MSTNTPNTLQPKLLPNSRNLWVLTLLLPTWTYASTEPASEPLYLSVVSSKPNIMLMIDSSGSMGTTVYSPALEISDMPSDYTYTCDNPIANVDARGVTVTIKIQIGTGSVVQICRNRSCTSYTNFSSSYCFNPTLSYKIAYSDGTLFGTYSGLNLDWYLTNGSFTAATKLVSQSENLGSRTSNAKQAATDLVNSLIPSGGEQPTLRLGLSCYNGSGGGTLVMPVLDLDATVATTATDKIAALPANTNTPLATTLSDIGRYFTNGYTGYLTLHPGKTNESNQSIDTIFTTRTITPNDASVDASSSPIQSYCQKSFVILISDGLPNGDRAISTQLSDYTGDCGIKGLCIAASNSINLPGAGNQALVNVVSSGGCPDDSSLPQIDKKYYNLSCQNGTKAGRIYETGGSDYLDDVAQALYEMDLRPDLGVAQKRAANGLLKNNLTTYAIGLADRSLQDESLLSYAAKLGGGEFFFASDSKTLAESLKKVINTISGQVGSSSSVTTNSSNLTTGVLIYQAKFDSADWSGSFLAHPVNSSGGLTVDAHGDLIPIWNAAEKIPDWDKRNILSYDPASSVGINFQCGELNPAQKSALGISNCNTSTDVGLWRLNYLRGDWSHEKANPLRKDVTNEKRSGSDLIFGNRTHLDTLTAEAIGKDPWVLGDIVNSNPVFVGPEDDYGYSSITAGDSATPTFPEQASYSQFQTAIANRRSMVYVGANDGMLHGFDGSNNAATGSTSGQEIVAYIPNAMYSKLAALASLHYDSNHQYFVDGSPNVGDAYLSSASKWRTVLVGTTGAGGKAVFALDVTDPGIKNAATSNIDKTNVLWEVSDAIAPKTTDLESDSSSVRGFANNLGFTLSQASVLVMNNGSWSVIFANGYYSTNNLAVLYILDINNGHIIRTIEATNTDESGFTTANGLSNPFPADIDGSGTVDYIYAGDLRGNMWKFDVTSTSADDWGVANAGKPLYIACDDRTLTRTSCTSSHRQPITSRPMVGDGTVADTLMVYFGTGKYFDEGDNDLSSPQMQTFYAIQDKKNVVVPSSGTIRSTLTEQTIDVVTTISVTKEDGTVEKTDYRLTSQNSCENKEGWYMDLRDPASPPVSTGERVVSFPILHEDRIIFTTLIPLPASATEADNACNSVSSGTGWLMEMTASCGASLPTSNPPWDLNGDDKIDSGDLVNGKSPGGRRADGIPYTPAIIPVENGLEKKCINTSTGHLDCTYESRKKSLQALPVDNLGDKFVN